MEKVLICDCGLREHQLVFSKSEDKEDTIYIDIKLNGSFWRRVKWLFGYKSSCGEYDSITTSKEKLINLLNDL